MKLHENQCNLQKIDENQCKPNKINENYCQSTGVIPAAFFVPPYYQHNKPESIRGQKTASFSTGSRNNQTNKQTKTRTQQTTGIPTNKKNSPRIESQARNGAPFSTGIPNNRTKKKASHLLFMSVKTVAPFIHECQNGPTLYS